MGRIKGEPADPCSPEMQPLKETGGGGGRDSGRGSSSSSSSKNNYIKYFTLTT